MNLYTLQGVVPIRRDPGPPIRCDPSDRPKIRSPRARSTRKEKALGRVYNSSALPFSEEGAGEYHLFWVAGRSSMSPLTKDLRTLANSYSFCRQFPGASTAIWRVFFAPPVGRSQPLFVFVFPWYAYSKTRLESAIFRCASLNFRSLEFLFPARSYLTSKRVQRLRAHVPANLLDVAFATISRVFFGWPVQEVAVTFRRNSAFS